ncbi:hypothetical protein LPH44_01310 [Xylella taiwanensis]|uniref:Uncharacterized protein n=1 Tax=Xylella taiwanensis TaxID=1444770 RepID=A0ABS8TVV8_9GAMM|nr:hypothetical protein [Xylella taiwanensis]MCD8469973.1 hypothetical protein [Xylella taiwanensis]MCD8473040.1 hypothetical protein [Xylella taiwanensis]QKD97707.1 hypothetical protein PLS229_01315 [Xylella taiwanensis]UFN05337.1 hypothetical protein LPH41_04950 [Xylella taiwanensis]UFN11567.1 hypothetical protein LPH44_01310 [Xylella taiwanensis]
MHRLITTVHLSIEAMHTRRQHSFRNNPRLQQDLSTLHHLDPWYWNPSNSDLAVLKPAYDAFYTTCNQVEYSAREHGH